jgi:hypothetical protein
VLPPGEAVNVHDAAQALGISVDGVRKRIARGTLEYYKEKGRVMVILPGPIEQGSLLPVSITDETPESYARVIGPYMTRIEELSRRNGELTAELQHARADLRAAERLLRKLMESTDA